MEKLCYTKGAMDRNSLETTDLVSSIQVGLQQIYSGMCVSRHIFARTLLLAITSASNFAWNVQLFELGSVKLPYIFYVNFISLLTSWPYSVPYSSILIDEIYLLVAIYRNLMSCPVEREPMLSWHGIPMQSLLYRGKYSGFC